MVKRLESIYRGTGHGPTHGFVSGPQQQDAEFARAFRDFEIDIDALPSAQAAAQITSHPVRSALVKALDEWASLRQDARGKDNSDWKNLVDIARLADPDPWRNRCRQALLRGDRPGLEQLADATPLRQIGPGSVYLLALALKKVGSMDKTLQLLRRAQHEYPGDMVINESLSYFSRICEPPRWDDALRFSTVTMALRPDEAVYHRAVGDALKAKGALEDALIEYSKAVEISEKMAARYPEWPFYRKDLAASRQKELAGYNDAAWFLATCPEPKFRDPGRAVALAQRAVELDPKEGKLWNTLGAAQYRAGNWKAAARALEKSIELSKGGQSVDWFFLAMAYWQLGEREKARTWFEQAMKAKDWNRTDSDMLYREAAAVLGRATTWVTPWSDSDQWVVKGQEVHQLDAHAGHVLLFGDPNWSDYDFEAETEIMTGGSEVGLIFRAIGPYRRMYAVVGAFGNSRHGVLIANGGDAAVVGLTEGKSEKGRWYRLRVETRGNRFKKFLDGKLVTTVDSDTFPHGCVGLITNPARARFRNLKVTDTAGSVLLEGVQDVLPKIKKKT
jgi:tetratricopeptide (TPR) repeat protein